MHYGDLVGAADRVAATTKRNEKVAILADLLRHMPADQAEIAVGLLLGKPRQRRLGVGWASLVGRHNGASESSVTKFEVPSVSSLTIRDASATGDRGISSLTIRDVDEAFTELAGFGGTGSQRGRREVLDRLFQRATPGEADHLTAVIIGEIRQGANEGVVTDALAKSAELSIGDVRRAAMLLGGVGPAAAAVAAGVDLGGIGLQPGTAVQPMLATSTATVSEAVEAIGTASVEAKLDGARVQIHRRGDDIQVFSRSLREISAAVPTVVAAARQIDRANFVVDGEALGLDDDGDPLAFQDTMQAQTALRPFFFDILSVDGESLIDRSLLERRAILQGTMEPSLVLPSIVTDHPGQAEAFAAQMIAAGHEGVMVKDVQSTYEAGRRGAAWRKVKPVYTFDLVVLAAEWGSGRRSRWLSNLHLGARAADGTFVMVGKTFKGLTDDLLRWQTETFPTYSIGHERDAGRRIVHLRPELVVEIAIDGVQRSTRYPGGVALRFARVRRYRPDKTAAQADPIEALQAMLRPPSSR
ncbi:MAG TPA: ATP-dependent DNA ligase [Ilumatobacteraceae bacterium]|nr:ATP-dependent DNA ligase [Ilumatobacteraceae bacterium]